MKAHFLTIAESKLDDVFSYYENELEGLGYRFLDAVFHSISRITQFPSSYQEIGAYSRRCLVHKFPYSVIYRHRKEQQEILIVAIAHLHRRPDYWISREP